MALIKHKHPEMFWSNNLDCSTWRASEGTSHCCLDTGLLHVFMSHQYAFLLPLRKLGFRTLQEYAVLEHIHMGFQPVSPVSRQKARSKVFFGGH